ncbi:transposase [Chryseobacterium sp.]|uniref:transposase n=1 Tax=Chryseobacterium sp. TaxID=1871047 RepID=UPI003219FF44
MSIDFKNIHVGKLIKKRVEECGIETFRICNFLKCTEDEVNIMYRQEDMRSDLMLRWSKLLEYDLFRLYSQHLILFSPPANANLKTVIDKKKSDLPQFRKNIYTKEIIDFIMELIQTGEKTRYQVIEEYRIPKTTLYKWLDKYNKTGKEFPKSEAGKTD